MKEKPYGNVNKLKSKLMAKRFHRVQGFNINETFCIVVNLVTIELILTLTITYKCVIWFLDLNNVLLNAWLMKRSTWNNHKDCGWSFRFSVQTLKALYGLKQALKLCFEKLKDVIIQLGFNVSKYNPSHFPHCLKTSKWPTYLFMWMMS